METLAWHNTKRVYTFLKLFCVCFYHFPMLNHQKHTFSFRPFISGFADTMSMLAKTKTYLVFKKHIPDMLVFVKAYKKKTPSKKMCVGPWESNLEQSSLCIFMKSMIISPTSDSLLFTSQSWLDFGQIYNIFMEVPGLRALQSLKYMKKVAFFLLWDRNTAWTGLLTKYSECDFYPVK